MKCGIYCIENKTNNKKYIGQSKQIEERKRGHFFDIKNKRLRRDGNGYIENIHLLRATEKYGINNFEFYIIEECLPSELNKKEIYWIDKYKTLDRKYGYNIELGGNQHSSFLGKKHSSKTLKKMSEIKLGNKNPFFGKRHTKKAKEKMAKWSEERKHTEFTKLKVSLSKQGTNKNGKFVGVHHRKYKNKIYISSSIKFKQKMFNLGTYKTDEEAVEAYDVAAIKYFGKTAKLNFEEKREEYIRRLL